LDVWASGLLEAEGEFRPAQFRALLDNALLNAIFRMAVPLQAQASDYFLESESFMLILGSIMSNAAIPSYLGSSISLLPAPRQEVRRERGLGVFRIGI
jgi:hypothetical protein